VCVCVCVYLCLCFPVCRYRPCDELITRPRGPTSVISALCSKVGASSQNGSKEGEKNTLIKYCPFNLHYSGLSSLIIYIHRPGLPITAAARSKE
jgi:hypothetical protein